MADTFEIKDLEKRMHGAMQGLRHEFSGLRTGRANAAMLDPILVDVYGQRLPINQVGTVSVPEPRTIAVQVWDKATVAAVEKAIRDSNLGVSPSIDGQIIRLRMPDLTEERRKEIVKIAHKYSEAARVAIRNVRRDGMELLKKLEKDKKIGEDDHRKLSVKVQELTDKTIKEVDGTLHAKEADIMHV